MACNGGAPVWGTNSTGTPVHPGGLRRIPLNWYGRQGFWLDRSISAQALASLTQRPCSSADDLHLSRQLDKHREVRRIVRNCAQRHVETDCISAPAADFLYR